MDVQRRTRPRPGRAGSFLISGLTLVGLALAAGSHASAAPPALAVQKGDHIAFIGNTVVDRMQHDGWLETLLQARFPGDELVIRNMGFSADELTIRLRSKDFGTPDEWLARTKSDVVFAFFGSNEAYGDPATYRQDLDAFVKHTLAQAYAGKGAPRLVLFSPIAHEGAKGRPLPDGAAHNALLEKVTAATAEVAKANGVAYVDLYHPSLKLFAESAEPLTINGIHPNEEGNRQLAKVIDGALFGEPAPAVDAKALDAIRAAVLEKNHYWFNRYRVVDGYSTYGGRADLKFTDGQTNRVVMDRELEVLDLMTANRDKAVWAAANGKTLAVDDSNTPPFIPVKTNKPGEGPNGEHIFLDGDAAIGKMTVGKDFNINLFASEKQFPDLAKPVQMSFDPAGRLWVAVWPTYPHWKPKESMNDKIIILEDTDGDGRADKQTTFADGLHCPTGFEFVPGGVLVAQQPDLMLLKDTNGDDKADVRTRVLHGLDSADTHHAANSFRLDPGGSVYFQEGTFHHTQVETPYGPPVRCVNAGVYRYEPRTQKFEVYVSYGFANPHGHSFDRWGQDFITDGTGAVNYFAAAFSGHVDYPRKHPGMKPFFPQRTRPCPGTEIVSSKHFPDEMQGNYLVGNVIGFQGILNYKMRDEESGFGAEEVEPIVSSSDPNFRPSDLEMGPDGALYFLDWQNPIIGHMQHNLRDPGRDRIHGRIYRVTAKGRPLSISPKIAGEPLPKLFDLLKETEDRVRYRVKLEIGDRKTEDVLAALGPWVAGLDKADPDYEHNLLEALWVKQNHDSVDVDLLKQLLAARDYRARAAATRVLCYWRDRVPGALGLLKTLAADAYPRVRLEAVRAASFFTSPEAIEVALISAEQPSDYYLDYVRAETLKTLEPYWRKALAEGRPVEFSSEAGARFFLKGVGTDDLLKMKRSVAVASEILLRGGVDTATRGQALADLAKARGVSRVHALIESLKARDGLEPNARSASLAELAGLLTDVPQADLAGVRKDLEGLATGAARPDTRQLGFAALVDADGSAEAAWTLATKSASALREFLAAIPLVRDAKVRESLYPRVEGLLKALPAPLASTNAGKGVVGRYVRVELPGPRRTLTLAEVEVISDGRNVARSGKASQKNTANGGVAARAIDGKTSGAYNDNGQTHSEEGTDSPWWEVDLGADVPIDSIVIHNRVDGELGRRLLGYTLKVLDSGRKLAFEKAGQPAPEPKATLTLEGNAGDVVRRAAMLALTSIPGHEERTFRSLSALARAGVDRDAAVLALGRLPKATWPKDEAGPLLDSLAAALAALPAADRTTPQALEALQLGDQLTGLLPKDAARAARARLGALGVRIIKIGTVYEQMRYDLDTIAVQAGKPVQIVFANIDAMPHNFVVVQPGSLETVGQLGEAQATQPDAVARQYVPVSDKILISSRMIQQGESQKLDFKAPETPGVYPYVCTYPGHWRRMFGAMRVVENLDDYLADPEGYLAANPLAVKDELLKLSTTRKEWTYEELAAAVTPVAHGRSFTVAKQVFRKSSCVSCHQLGGEGVPIGPDLTKLDAKLTPADLLKSMLEPSAKIDDAYAQFLFDTESGQLVSGLVVEETADAFKVVENPLAKATPLVVKKSDVVARKRLNTSIMPKGLLDTLNREEILDLIAYIVAKGDKAHPLFKGGHEGHGNAH
ncbi:GDSL-type esterase/lipase family protein [Isosphaeraceae bacterium EP7]